MIKDGITKIIFGVVVVFSAVACSTMDNRDYVANKNNNITVAKAQSLLRKGMTGDEVAVALAPSGFRFGDWSLPNW